MLPVTAGTLSGRVAWRRSGAFPFGSGYTRLCDCHRPQEAESLTLIRQHLCDRFCKFFQVALPSFRRKRNKRHSWLAEQHGQGSRPLPRWELVTGQVFPEGAIFTLALVAGLFGE